MCDRNSVATHPLEPLGPCTCTAGRDLPTIHDRRHTRPSVNQHDVVEMNMPIDRKDWAQRFPEFLVEAETLLAKSEECLSHLQLISNDKDAIDCMLGTLLKLAGRAEALALEAISEFSLHIYSLLNLTQDRVDLHEQALDALRDCFTLMAWQLELVDHKTGQLSLDGSEQTALLEAFAAQMGQDTFEPKMMSKRLLSTSLIAHQA